MGCATKYLTHRFTVLRLADFSQCAFQMLSPSAIIIPHRLTFGNITTYLHTQLQATWTLQSHRLLHAFYSRVPERGGRRRGQLLIPSTVLTRAENLSSDIYRILNPGHLSIQSANAVTRIGRGIWNYGHLLECQLKIVILDKYAKR